MRSSAVDVLLVAAPLVASQYTLSIHVHHGFMNSNFDSDVYVQVSGGGGDEVFQTAPGNVDDGFTVWDETFDFNACIDYTDVITLK